MYKLLNQQGVIHILPLLLIIAAVGIISFLLISSTLPLNGIFGTINPKQASRAASLQAPGTWVNVTPGNMNVTTDLPCGNYGVGTMLVDPARPSDLYTHVD